MAVGVIGYRIPTDNYPHITLAINKENGATPFLSNKIDNWYKFKQPIELNGVVTNITTNG